MQKTMTQQIVTAPRQVTYEEVAVPELEPNQVLVKMMRIGICGSDIHVWHGEHPYTSYPISQGHEVSGEVVALGSEVEGLEVGQKVTIEPQVVCGECYSCRTGTYNTCEKLKVLGFQTTGAGSNYFAADAKRVTPLPDPISFDEGAMIEPLSVAVHAVKRSGDVTGKIAVVLGAGTIGILVLQALKAMGASEVMVTDISDYRLELAKELGADYVLNTKEHDYAEALAKNFGPDNADIVYDCAGNDITINQAIQHARKGSQIVLIAVFAKMANVDLAKLNDSELILNTSMMFTHEDFVKAIELVADGKVNLKPLISKHFEFEEFKDAYDYIDANREKTMKVMVKVHN